MTRVRITSDYRAWLRDGIVSLRGGDEYDGETAQLLVDVGVPVEVLDAIAPDASDGEDLTSDASDGEDPEPDLAVGGPVAAPTPRRRRPADQ